MDALLTPEGFLDPRAAGLAAIFLTQWLKIYLPDKHWSQLLVLGITAVLEVIAAAITGADYWAALAAAFWGATLATFGYEAVKNAAELLGLNGKEERR
ncbi:MAG: hypothetical protein H5T65_11470 [Chloroflexi bacterium]|nr:hypothetical protein [Chloroflexota bacterium]